MQTLTSYDDGSRSRQQCATALAALARHLELPLPEDWRQEAGGYGLHRARFRQLPTDPQILEAAGRIPNPQWRLAFALMATYGLRNHEVFFCDCSSLAPGGDRVLRVLPTTKTGEHQAGPSIQTGSSTSGCRSWRRTQPLCRRSRPICVEPPCSRWDGG